jgi:hypothetical protein
MDGTFHHAVVATQPQRETSPSADIAEPASIPLGISWHVEISAKAIIGGRTRCAISLAGCDACTK